MTDLSLALRRAGIFLLFFCALFLTFYVNGALPFFGIPTVGQAVWTAGFAQSFLNHSSLTLYAHNFGAPAPAAIAFGLAGALPVALFMKLGLHAADAYSGMVALWIALGFWGAYRISRYFGCSGPLSILAAMTWTTMPMIWAHAGYSMLSTGIALLPLYMFASLRLFGIMSEDRAMFSAIDRRSLACYPLLCILAVFMDGYSFMMFAIGSSLIGIWSLIAKPPERRRTVQCLIFHSTCLGIAYVAYALYIGQVQFNVEQLDFFRGWGADVTFFLIPSAGLHWLPDFLGLSLQRSTQHFFGDESVWMTTFSLPAILGAAFMLILARKNKFRLCLILIAAFGFYMSLGPSLKFNSTKPAGRCLAPLMAAKYAVAPTGSALLSAYLPGFKNMRASYRWAALGVWGLWALVVLGMVQPENRRTVITAAAVLSLIMIMNLPDLSAKYNTYKANRSMFLSIDRDLVNDMATAVRPGERVVFLPWGNDFLANYLAAKLDVETYNVGGDKNLAEAMRHWPNTMRQFPIGCVDDRFVDNLLLMLARGDANVVVLPYIDMLSAAHQWPESTHFKERLQPVIEELRHTGFVNLDERVYYATARLHPTLNRLDAEERVRRFNAEACLPPYCLKRSSLGPSTPTIVGELVGGAILSTGQSGFLHFGPYVWMKAGRYVLEVYGRADKPTASWVDIVGGRGTVVYARFPFGSRRHSPEVLLKEVVKLSKPVEDLEVRVYAGEGARLKLTGFRLSPDDPMDGERKGNAQSKGL